MIRTKYLLVSILVCLFTIMGAGVFSVAPHTMGTDTRNATVIFATPQDSYRVEKYADRMKDGAREDFIEKVRDSIAHDPVVPIQQAPQSAEEDIEEETSIVSSPVVIPPPTTPEPIPEPVTVEEPVAEAPVSEPIPEPLVTSTDTTVTEIQTEEGEGEATPTI